ncbi:hypothetical protein COT62_00135 [Candidatus Roizmanbacteria bacterium CG09_land_8_20_14_0_10_41_9]|uniref:Glycosyltransferase 2-like domain-containing protein n=1 Tax=Candidatus Roizmanbacteria bacterium CG09_land_8_20_14_0_10_41_9 TaxID=1974850 RepID=A0A2H0WTY0_9BACT|nr:MAG: hypothetical protein COT62_00135 [Candidatus Roizmanbacteria bacterium CG09_land_8_20_14_0_10_41_9]
MITAVILAKNEEKHIGKTIQSLSFCNEIIVVDDNSNDATREIAEKLGCRVLPRSLNSDFAGQRNFAMEQAKHDWILFVDADEEVTTELRENILQNVTNNTRDIGSYALKRRDFFWGKELQYGETKKARSVGLIRLMKKRAGVWHGSVHEAFVPHGTTGSLTGFLDHFPHQTISEFLQDINFYSSLRARELARKQKTATVFSLLFFPLGKFILTYIIYLGFLDGPAGFTYAFMMSFHSFLTRAKLFQYGSRH